MWRYLVMRAVQSGVVLILASVGVFLLIRALPGDPALVYAGTNASMSQIIAIRKEMGLNAPLPSQYAIWARHLLEGNMGTSFQNDYPVIRLLGQRLPATVQLAIAALGVAILLSLPLGLTAALAKGRPADYLITAATGLGLATPTFWFGIVAILVFAIRFNWLPASGYTPMFPLTVSFFKHLLLPAVTLAVPVTSALTRFVRSAVLEVLRQDYVRTAQSKGLSGLHLLRRHVLSNVLITVGTVVGLYLGGLLGGVVVIESVFAWPGVGALLLNAIVNRDYAVLQAGLLVLIVTFSVVNLMTDVMYALFDPRIRLGGRV
jgi:ABC-type dipeptide/oligopeptide/nickel transport system permease component